MPIYFDQASSSFPKPAVVADAVYEAISNNGISINRSSNRYSYQLESNIYDTRELINEFFNGYGVSNIAFTKNITESLNIIIKGLLKSGDHVIISPLEHNAVLRPLHYMTKFGVEYSIFDCDSEGTIDLASIERLIKPNTRAIITTHASNVSGTILPITEIGMICKAHNLLFIVDSAQTAGVLPIDMKAMNIDILCFTGHKSLLGPQGIGGFLLRKGLQKSIIPLIHGGTGSISFSESMPEFMPDRFEAGTQNTPAILGLSAGLKWLKDKGIENIYNHEKKLCEAFLNGANNINSIKIVSKKTTENRLGLVSIASKDDIALLAQKLEEKGIITRVGLHCAPLAHKNLFTYPQGTIRFSFGYFNTLDEVETVIKALEELV